MIGETIKEYQKEKKKDNKKMRKMGLEPTRHCCHKILSLARLPVPTLPHLRCSHNSFSITKDCRFVNVEFEKNIVNSLHFLVPCMYDRKRMAAMRI